MDINGFPIGATAETGRATAKIVTYRVPGTDVSLPLCSEVAPLLIGLAAEFHNKVEALAAGTCWGYAYRNVRGDSRPSFHSAGIAIDLNAPRHPLGKRGTFTTGQAATCRALATKYGCRWGGDYTGRADEMHFEIIVPRAQALTMVTALQTPTGAQPTGGYPLPAGHLFRIDRASRPDWHDGRDGNDTAAIQHIQRAVGGSADGVYGAGTEAAVRRWQAGHGLTVDGIVGPRTWASLAVKIRMPGKR